MTIQIFGTYASAYYDAGLPVIPLRPMEKVPLPLGWSEYCTKLPPKDLFDSWTNAYSNGNIGLALGSCSGLVAIDIDTDREDVLAILHELLPPTAWERVGKKGKVMMYRWSGHRAAKIKSDAGEMLVEILSTGNQVVLPPSIHPETRKPYTANSNLWEVYKALPELPKNFEELLRERLKSEGIALSISGRANLVEWVAQGDRDNSIVRNAGLLARQVLAGKITLADALTDIQTFVKDRMENVCGDPIDEGKAVEKVIEFVRKDVMGREKILPVDWDRGLTDEQKTQFGLAFDRDRVAWTSEEIMNHLRDEVIGRVSDGVLHQELRAALARVAANAELREHELERATLFRWIAHSCGSGVTVAALNKEYQNQLRGEIAGANHAEIARAVIDDIKEEVEDGEVRFHMDHFWEWSGSCWRIIDEGSIRKRIAENYGHLAAAKRFSDVRGILAVMQDLERRPLGQDKVVGINFANGFLTEELRLENHDREFGATYTLNFCYDPKKANDAPRWFAMLHTAWGQDDDYLDKVQALREFMCVTLFGKATAYQRVILLKGPGKCGKSQVLDVMRSLMPPGTTSNLPPTEWGDKFAPSGLVGKLMNVAGEISDTKMIDGAAFKEIVAGEVKDVQFKGRNAFAMKPKAAHWFAANSLPKTRDTSSGFSRRWLILTFNHPVPAELRVLNISEIVASEEREAIVAWAVSALPELVLRREFTLPPSHAEEVEQMAQANGGVRFFILGSGRIQLTGQPTDRMSADDLMSEYEAHCRREGSVRPVGRARFMMSMRELSSELPFSMDKENLNQILGMEKWWFSGLTLVV